MEVIWDLQDHVGIIKRFIAETKMKSFIYSEVCSEDRKINLMTYF